MKVATKYAGVICLSLACTAWAEESHPLRTRQQAQEAARSLAVDLVSAVLDLQLRQLEENGLAELPIYRDVQSMRANVSELIADKMSTVVRLLEEAQAAAPDSADGKWKDARQAIRDVVAGLMAERQKLHRRMHVSRLAAQARELVALQQKMHALTRSLGTLAAGERERTALAAIEGQADVQELYLQFMAGLADVSHWGGAAAAGAVDGLRILQIYEVEQALERGCEELKRAKFAEAAARQAAALAGLAALAERLEQLEGLANADREAALRLVRELIARQKQVRDACHAAALNEQTAMPLVEQQTALHKELAKLPLALAKYPATTPLIEEAKAASFEATARLFEAQQGATVEQQGRVITNLAQIARLLEDGLDGPQAGRSADAWAAEIEKFSRLAGILSEAASEKTEIGQALEQVQALGELPSIVQTRLDDVAERAAEQRDDVVAALRLAEAEVATELADARRKHKAVEVGELARAAEALERASAAERTIGRQMQLAAARELPAEQRALLAAEHADVSAVAERIAAGVLNTAPQAAAELEDVQTTLAQTSAELEKLAADGPNAKQVVETIGDAAGRAARELAEAAAVLRAAQGASAKQLESIAGGQLGVATAALEAVSTALESGTNPAAEALVYLLEARWQLGDAAASQARAEGKPGEAEALLAVREVKDLLTRQQQAEDAARELASGRATSPLDAAAVQQKVSEGASRLATKSTGELREKLHVVATAAGEAGRLLLTGSHPQAAKSRSTASEGLQVALDSAMTALNAVATHAAGTANKQAQAQVADDLAAARQSALEAGLAGAESAALLEKARLQALVALKHLDSTEQLLDEQIKTKQLLSEAGEALERAIKAIASKQASRLGERAKAAGELVEQASAVDAAAATALNQAVNSATHAGSDDVDAEGVSRALAHVQSKLEQATANLAAREQQLKRDRDLAHLLAEFAEDQQEARDAIVQAAAELEQMKEADSTQRLMAAQALLQAQQRFVQTIVATGEGAAAVSGQEEVANQPIREALEIATGLGDANEQAKAQESGDRGQESGEGRPGDNKKNGKADADARFVPAQPQQTAQQIAGPAANAKAAQMMAEAMEGMGQGVPGEGQGEQESSQEGSTAATAKKGGATKGSQTAKNEAPPKGDLETADAAESDSRAKEAGEDAVAGAASGVAKEAWFARLPAEIRSAIQARARAKAPRGYEERLRRYFESVD
jgi:hypothetical protein